MVSNQKEESFHIQIANNWNPATYGYGYGAVMETYKVLHLIYINIIEISPGSLNFLMFSINSLSKV